ncbi:MAG: enoyl-CoA hydratase [Alphaproteobacteria bacterium]|jgi:enoyl-CoA hydratase
MTDDVVTYESNNNIAIITINRADKLNALTGDVVTGIRNAFIKLNESDDRCAILRGTGDRAFSVGADLKDPPRDPALWECMPGVGIDVDKPLIAAVSGYCVGGAYCLVQFCDIAVADDTADFFYPEAQIGFCGGLIAGLAARLPQKIAMEFMMTGKHFSAQRAFDVGMVNKVVPKGQLMEGAMEYAEIFRDSAPLVLATLKRFVRDEVIARGPSEQSAYAQRDLLAISRSEDQQEGARSFKEKRKPVFRGR